MRIAIDVSPLDRPYATGVEKALLQLLRCLDRDPGGHDYLLVAPKRPQLLPSIEKHWFRMVELAADAPKLLWRERLVPPFANREGVHLWYSPVQAIPLLLDKPKVATLHELSWLETRGVEDEGNLHRRRLITSLMAKAADRIVCVSDRTRQNFSVRHPQAADKCRTVYHGVESRFHQAEARRQAMAERYGLPAQAPYLLTVGRALKRKGLPHAVRAFRVLLDRTGGPHHLVLAGPHNRQLLESRDLAMRLGLQDRLHLPGYVAESDLPAIYAGADVFLMPSESEGFGIPILEAMAAGVPVIANRRAALPEVAGDGAVLVDFEKPLEVAEAVLKVSLEQRERWIRRGRERAAAFPEHGPCHRLQELWAELVS
ncbi:MAG: glycosyltransferase family 1 protein [Planctomycetota bacterium]|nr:MAG: glycosyltransferase family 1 protein [Planctomycetota bacterium]